jgi:hypothetical protein
VSSVARLQLNKKNNMKKIIALTTLSLTALASANAQTDTIQNTNLNTNFGERILQHLTGAQKSALEQARKLFDAGKKEEARALLDQNKIVGPYHKGGKFTQHSRVKDNKKEIAEAVIKGSFADFQKVASATPLRGINQATFNSLIPHFTAKKNAEDQIHSILKNAGVELPQKEQR